MGLLKSGEQTEPLTSSAMQTLVGALQTGADQSRSRLVDGGLADLPVVVLVDHDASLSTMFLHHSFLQVDSS